MLFSLLLLRRKKSSPLLKLPTHEAFSLAVPKEIEYMRGEMKDILAHTDSWERPLVRIEQRLCWLGLVDTPFSAKCRYRLIDHHHILHMKWLSIHPAKEIKKESCTIFRKHMAPAANKWITLGRVQFSNQKDQLLSMV